MNRDILLSIISAAMLVIAFPPIDLSIFAWIGMAPFFFVLEGKTKGKAFLLSFFWGFVFFLGTIYWVVNSMVNYGGIPFFTSCLILLLLAIFLSLFHAAFGFLSATVLSNSSSLLKLLFIPSNWVSLEYIRGNAIEGGFPWVLLGYSQSSSLSLIQVADITGVYGISFLAVMFNVFIFISIKGRILKSRNQKLEVRSNALSPFFKEGFVILIVLIIVLGYGLFRINQIDKISYDWKTLKIGIAQGNIDQGRKWDASFRKETVDIYRNLSLTLAKNKVDLLVWPETAVPFYLQSDKDLGPQIFDVPRETNTHLFTGSPAYGLGVGNEVKYYNSAFLITPQNEITGRYDKVRLVPFGEYVPFKKYLPFIHKLVVGVGDFTSGNWLKPLEFNGNSFGVLICFESIFPELSRGFVKEGAGFLINITNDAWFGRTSAPYQHFSQSVFRAVENKVFLVRAANTGISGVIDPVGRVKLKSGIFTKEALTADIKIRDAQSFTPLEGFSGRKLPGHSKGDNLRKSPLMGFTFYSRYGDIFAIGCLIAVVIFLLIGIRKNVY